MDNNNEQPKPESNTSLEKDKQVIEIVKDYTSTQDENSPIILVNPAHGNEPYILGTAIAKGVSNRLREQGLGNAKIVVPLMYGERQKKILIEENPNDTELIYYDDRFGQILKDITFQNGNFSDHLKQVETHYDEVEALLGNRFSYNGEGFEVRGLGSNQEQVLSPKNVVATIDTAARVMIEAPQRYFAFPILLSELLEEAQQENLGFSEADLSKVIERMLKVESAYSKVFIPKINPLSYKYAKDLSKQPEIVDGRERTYTPAMKSDYEKTQGKVDEPGIYVMFSGTGSNSDATKRLVASANESNLRVYSPPWVDVEGAIPVSPDVLNDEKILAVMGRGGWGTGWQVQNLALPWIVTPYDKEDDPEIYFNNKTIEALKMGKVLGSSDMTPERLKEIIGTFSVGVQGLNDKIKAEFGTLNGIDYISDAIVEDFLSKK